MEDIKMKKSSLSLDNQHEEIDPNPLGIETVNIRRSRTKSRAAKFGCGTNRGYSRVPF